MNIRKSFETPDETSAKAAYIEARQPAPTQSESGKW